MIEAIFYIQVIFFAVLLGYAMYTRSAAVFALAGVFSILTGVMLVGEGISYQSGWNINGADDNSMYVEETYTTYHTYESGAVNMWHYVLLYGGFVWFIVAFMLVMKGRLAGGIQDEKR